MAFHWLWNHQAPQMQIPCEIFYAHLAAYLAACVAGKLDPALDAAMTCHIQPQPGFGDCKPCREALRRALIKSPDPQL